MIRRFFRRLEKNSRITAANEATPPPLDRRDTRARAHTCTCIYIYFFIRRVNFRPRAGPFFASGVFTINSDLYI